MNEPIKLLRAAKVAKMLDCHVSHIYALVSGGELPAMQTGRKKGIRISEQDLTKFVNDRRINQIE